MKTKPFVMDQRIVDAINTLEIYKQMFEETGFLTKAAHIRIAIEDLKVCAYDSHSCVDQGSVTEEDDHQLGEMIFENDTGSNEDFGPIIEPDMSPDERVCNGILQEIVKKTPLFVWYNNCRGAHTVWTNKVYLVSNTVVEIDYDGWNIGRVEMHDEDGFAVKIACRFDESNDEITFNGKKYIVDYHP